ncbi:TPA: excisionase [Candidatus Wolfebacteria bacterium]|jgi:excisionase family DNA binding protein|nr:excisionase [Candidatus Wolfebacteria bacterium]
MTKKTPKDYFTAKEAADILHVSERTIMRYIKTKRLLATKIGQWRIKKADIDRLVKASSNK